MTTETICVQKANVCPSGIAEREHNESVLVLQVSGAALGESLKGEVWGRAEQWDSATGKCQERLV